MPTRHENRATWIMAMALCMGLALSISGCDALKGGKDEKAAEPKKVDCETECPCECDCPETEDIESMAKSNEPYPMVFAGNVKVKEGTLPLSVAKRKITAQRYALRECYAPALKENKDLKGEMDVQFTVSGSTGKIIAAIVRDTTMKDNKDVQKCVTKKIKGLTFPKSDSKESVVIFTAVMLAVNL